MTGRVFVGRAAGQGWVYAQLWWGPAVLRGVCVGTSVGGKDRRGMGLEFTETPFP